MKKSAFLPLFMLSVTIMFFCGVQEAFPLFKSNGQVIDLPSAASFSEIISSGNVIIKFTADNCPPCHRMEPFLNQLAQAFGSNLLIVRVDVNKFRNLRDQYGIRSWPTLLFFRNGSMVRMLKDINPHELNGLTRALFSLN